LTRSLLKGFVRTKKTNVIDRSENHLGVASKKRGFNRVRGTRVQKGRKVSSGKRLDQQRSRPSTINNDHSAGQGTTKEGKTELPPVAGGGSSSSERGQGEPHFSPEQEVRVKKKRRGSAKKVRLKVRQGRSQGGRTLFNHYLIGP